VIQGEPAEFHFFHHHGRLDYYVPDDNGAGRTVRSLCCILFYHLLSLFSCLLFQAEYREPGGETIHFHIPEDARKGDLLIVEY
jgi:hypothetical protein